MPNLINENSVLNASWVTISDAEALSGSNLYVPISIWLEHANDLAGRSDVAPIIYGDTVLDEVIDSIRTCEAIAIDFPSFTDGRGYSQARLLREKFDVKSDLRAIGDVLLDQIFFMKRCGISSFELKDGIDAEKALNYLNTFSDPYQTSVERPTPLFTRR